jgi:hypothetical protein
MSYIYNREIQFADTAQNDAFGRLRTSEITSLLELKHVYDKQPFLEDEVVNGNGTSNKELPAIQLAVTTAGDYVIRQSFNSAPYQPGKSQIFEASFANLDVSLANKDYIIKRVGYFTSDITNPYNSEFDGFFLESTGDTNGVKFCIYNQGTLVEEASQTDWLTTDWDPANIDWTATQLMMVDYQWLGVGRVRFYMVLDGVPRLFFERTAANQDSSAYMLSPNKPIRYELRCITENASDTFDQICSQVSMEGSLNNLYKLASFANVSSAISIARNRICGILGFRLDNSDYRGVVAKLRNYSVLQTTNDNYVLRIIKNPVFDTVTPTWTNIDNTPISYDNTADNTYEITLGNGELILETIIGAAGSLGGGSIDFVNSALNPGFRIDGTPEEIWITVEPLSSNASFVVSMNVEYYD